MIYTDQNGCKKQLTPVDNWTYAAGHWMDEKGKTANFAEIIAKNGGSLTIDAKERKIALFALRYAKQRRQRNLENLMQEIDNLDTVINQL